jgi:tetratricopeptide (TPR) repeat protein
MPDSSNPPCDRGAGDPSGVTANPAGLKSPIPATAPAVRKELASRPLLWVGAGASVAAGYPGTSAILGALAGRADDPIGSGASFPRIVDAFVASRGAGELAEILQRLFEPRSRGDHQPTPVHRAIARLAGAGCFHAIATTNYDDLLERALADAGVPTVLQPLEANAAVAGDGAVRLLKLHGSREDWLRVVLSGRSYQEFGCAYPFLGAQLDELLRQRAVVFVGCSLQDPRLLDWLAAQTEDEARSLKPWRALMTPEAWQVAAAAVWEGGHASGALARGNVRALLLRDHGQLAEIWSELAAELAPEVRRLDLEIVVGGDAEPWCARLAGCPDWRPTDPLADGDLVADLAALRELDHRPLPVDEQGRLTPEAAGAAASLRALAASIGDRLAAALLSPKAGEVLAAAVHATLGGAPPLLHLRMRAAGAGEAAERRADRALALPWELLRLDGRFPVEEGFLDLAREAEVPGASGLGAPESPLAVVATFAAPVDATALDYEEEMYRLWRALGREELRLRVADLGTLDELVREVESLHPPVVHFSGHGRPGELLFEDEAALAHPVTVGELARRLREGARLPRLLYLSACHGATAGSAGRAAPGERMVDAALAGEATRPSTAASLHRAGFPQVVAYFGPVGDRQATRAVAAFYADLAAGRKAREALRRARRISAEPHREEGRPSHIYPLGWAQLALYHRGADEATALPAPAGGPIDLEEERRRIFEPVSRRGGTERVEGIRGVQRLRFGFVGRRQERALALRRWRRGGERRLVVVGLGGLGKTALCTELAALLARDLQAGGAPVLAFDGRHAGAQPPITALWQELQAAHEGDEWSRKLADLQRDGLTGEALGRAVGELAKLRGGLLVYIDDAESLQVRLEEAGQDCGRELGRFRDPELRRFWEVLVAATAPRSALGLLVSSRYLPEETPRDAAVYLPPLHRFEIVRLLAWMPTLGRLPAGDRAWLAERIDGHPRTVEYLEVLVRQREEDLAPPGGHYEGRRWREDILAPVMPEVEEKVGADLLLGKVWQALPADAQEHLGRCTAITAPAPWEAVLALQPAKGTAARLVETGMLSRFEALAGGADWWAPHRLVAEEAGRRWAGEPRDAHRRLGEWYGQRFAEERTRLWAERAVQHLTAAGEGDAAWPAARSIALDLRHRGRYREALAWVERVLAAAPTGDARGLALAHEVNLGRLAGSPPGNAEEILLQALDLVSQADRSFVLDYLGMLAARHGKLRKAADYLQQSVNVEIAQKGEVHRDVAASLHALAGVLQAQGDLPGARRLLERSLEIKAEVYGTEVHPDVAASLHELAGVLKAQGDLPGARRLLERSLEISAEVFGTEVHPDVAASLHALAGVLRAEGDVEGVRRTLERVIEIEALVYGTREHFSTAITEMALGTLLVEQGETEAGIGRLAHAHSVFLTQLGPQHPRTRRVAGMLEGLREVR